MQINNYLLAKITYAYEKPTKKPEVVEYFRL